MVSAGFTDIKIEVKENAADIIKEWMPGSGAEKFITSAYVTATKPKDGADLSDDVRTGLACTSMNLEPSASGVAEAGC